MDHYVYKFGGASIQDADHIRNVAQIVSKSPHQRLLIVISALGKMTNRLENVFNQRGRIDSNAKKMMDKILQEHIDIAAQLGLTGPALKKRLKAFLKESFKSIKKKNDAHDFVYDQLISLGELFSTALVASYLESCGEKVQWMDARDLIVTDDNYRDGRVDPIKTQKRILKATKKVFKKSPIIITQGFIAGAPDGSTTTLGREGSDYSAALFAYSLGVKELTVWKDVPGILNADPRRFPNATLLPRLSYDEAIQMTYYGAKVIHPKTIKPLKQKKIKLNVRSFLNPSETGTIISSKGLKEYPPIVIVEDDLHLVRVNTLDFSFIRESELGYIFNALNHYSIKVLVMKNTAYGLSMAVKTKNDSVLSDFKKSLKKNFTVDAKSDVSSFTFRHADGKFIRTHLKGKEVLLKVSKEDTAQFVLGH